MILVQMKNKDLTDFTIQFLLQNTKRHIYKNCGTFFNNSDHFLASNFREDCYSRKTVFDRELSGNFKFPGSSFYG